MLFSGKIELAAKGISEEEVKAKIGENVVDVIKGRKPIATNALEGLKIVDIIERIYALR